MDIETFAQLHGSNLFMFAKVAVIKLGNFLKKRVVKLNLAVIHVIAIAATLQIQMQ